MKTLLLLLELDNIYKRKTIVVSFAAWKEPRFVDSIATKQSKKIPSVFKAIFSNKNCPFFANEI
jgi:hypothetical protein